MTKHGLNVHSCTLKEEKYTFRCYLCQKEIRTGYKVHLGYFRPNDKDEYINVLFGCRTCLVSKEVYDTFKKYLVKKNLIHN